MPGQTHHPDGDHADHPEVGNVTDTVTIAIDYAIIQHFSQHLYGSPDKAIEELVANSYDALAKRVDIWIPGSNVADSVVVWDDGTSMGVDDLKRLWEIARSPKAKIPHRRISGVIDGVEITRDMIGKFGIGKLASYAVGDEITHLCRNTDGRYLKVAVRYPEVLDETRQPGDPYTTPVIELTEAEMRNEVQSIFAAAPENLENLLARPSWTLAKIGNLRAGVDLKEGWLRWVIGNGMPLQPDFDVQVNTTPVEPKLAAKARKTWQLDDLELTRTIAATWQDAVLEGKAQGTLLIGPSMSGAIPPAPKSGGDMWVATSEEVPDHKVRFPNLGDVDVTVRMYENSLLPKKDEERPRTHGFFVMVRKRLINSEDDKLFLHDPSFATFYRTQFQVNADGLDAELLADRERVRTTTPASKEFAHLQRGLNRAARGYFDQLDKEADRQANPVSLLPLESHELFRQPLNALLLAREEFYEAGSDFSHPSVTRGSYTSRSRLSDLDAAKGQFVVNQDHPLFQAVSHGAPGGASGQRFFRVFDVFAIAERLLEGHLYDIGMETDRVEAISEWRDRLLRALAARYQFAGEEVLEEVHQASFRGDRPFEEALAKMFNLMGFEATRDGSSGKKDILTVAPIGPKHFSLVVEAKGSQSPVGNGDADISSAASHRDAAGADHAIVVAREFAGFVRERTDGAAVVQECAATGGVSIVTLDVLTELYKAVQQYSYPLDFILPVLRENEAPAAKRSRVAALTDPLATFDYRRVLDRIWAEQQERAERDIVSFRPIWQEERSIDFESFRARLNALSTLSGGLITFPTQETVYLRQSPDQIVRRIHLAVAGKAQAAVGVSATAAPEPESADKSH